MLLVRAAAALTSAECIVMGMVIRLRQRAHARASTKSKAANAVRSSADSPSDRAFSVFKIKDQCSGGMLLRCHHLETCQFETPGKSAAMASRVAHSSTTDRNEVILLMPKNLGQTVLKCKDKVALDEKISLGHTVHMADETEDQFKQEFIARVKAARIATGKKQWQVAELLNVPQDHYKHWEKTRLMPHHLIGRFCIITNVDPNWLLSGRGAKPLKALAAVEQEPEPLPKPKKARRSKAA
jgi:DNA-binding transcriptional regulator YiaG